MSYSPHPVDINVGIKLRECRKSLGLSQLSVSTAVGLTFQQVQKYERGVNRVSASKLYELAQFMRVPIEYFFEGLDPAVEIPAPESPTERRTQMFLQTSEGVELAKWFVRISIRKRRGVLALVRSLDGDTA